MSDTDAQMHGSPTQLIRITMAHVVTAVEMPTDATRSAKLNETESGLQRALDRLIDWEDWVIVGEPQSHQEDGPSERDGEQISDQGDVLVEVVAKAWRRVDVI